jgi:Leucine-rich repeat (LRR) protein
MLACNAAFGVVCPKGKRFALHNKLSGAFLRHVSFEDLGLLGLDAQSLVQNIKLKVIAAKAWPHEWLSFRCIKLTCLDLGSSSTRVDVMYDESLARKVLEECLEAQIHESRDLIWDEDNTNHTKCSIDSIRVVLSASQPSLLPEVLLAESAKRVKVVGYGIDDKPGVSLVAKLRPAELYMENMTIDDVLSIIPISAKKLCFNNVRFGQPNSEKAITCFQPKQLDVRVRNSKGFENLFDQLPVAEALALTNQRVSPSIAKWVSLKRLTLADCGQVDLAWLPCSLQHLETSNVRLCSQSCVFNNMKDLYLLSLQSARLEGRLACNISNLTHLTGLRLKNNFLSGDIPSELFSLATLKALDLSYNFFSGGISADIQNLTDLEVLDLESNLLSGLVPTQIGALTSLKRISLSFNNLTGDLPTQIGDLASLEKFTASANHFSSSLPTQIGNLHVLRYVDLSDNNLCGQIPTELGFLASNVHIKLSRNQLCGKIPSELGMYGITTLDLSYNQLCGNIPKELGAFGINTLDLSHNQLCGNIPKELGTRFIATLDLSHNQLCGEVPKTRSMADTAGFDFSLDDFLGNLG